MKLPKKTANLQRELLAARKRERTESQLLSDISKILSENAFRRDAIRKAIKASAEMPKTTSISNRSTPTAFSTKTKSGKSA